MENDDPPFDFWVHRSGLFLGESLSAKLEGSEEQHDLDF